MIIDSLQTRLGRYEEQLQQQLLRRSQLQTALTQCDDLTRRLEGACGVLRELLAEPVPELGPSTGPNGADPAEPEI
jgi:hypothetical protein